jgi:sec-independent protein translocase protein TatA
MLGNLNGFHLLVLVLVILLLFGAPKLPALARSMGQSMRIFRKEVQTLNSEKEGAGATTGAEAGVEHSGPVSRVPAASRDGSTSNSSDESATALKL